MTGTTLVAVGCWNKERMECKGFPGPVARALAE